MGLFATEEEIVRRRAAKDERLRELVRSEVAAQLAAQPQLPPPPDPDPASGPRLSPSQLEELLPRFDSILAKHRPPFSFRPPSPYLRAVELLAKETGRSQNDLACSALREFLSRELAAYEQRNGVLPTDWIRDGDPDPDPPQDG
jgi:hypothetical protein